MKENQELKTYIRNHGIYLWQIADKLGVSETTILRWMRKDLSVELKEQIISIVDEIVKARM